jgi:LmbE family N-acetylglucosaminyl deacetylase
MADGESSRGGAGDPAAVHLIAHRNAAADAACQLLGCASVEIVGLPDNRMDGQELLDVVKLVERFVARHRPSVLFTHHRGDVNVDHQVTHEAVLAACRPQPGTPVRELLFFETASSTEWRPPGSSPAFAPNWFVDISDTLEIKLAALRAYEAEMRPFPHARSLRAVEALARWRGATVGVDAAEAFVLGRKLIT